MGRTRNVSKILTSNTSILSLASASTTYAPIAAGSLVQIVPVSVTATGGTATISSNGTVTLGSGISSISLNEVFSSTYQNYMLTASELKGNSTGSYFGMRMRSGTGGSYTDNSSAQYNRVDFQAYSTNALTVSYTSETRMAHVLSYNYYGTGDYLNLVYCYGPYSSTAYTSVFSMMNTGGAQNYESYATTVTTSYTGFTLTTGGGTVASGKISIYGIRQ
jgi:hypothetical protein